MDEVEGIDNWFWSAYIIKGKCYEGVLLISTAYIIDFNIEFILYSDRSTPYIFIIMILFYYYKWFKQILLYKSDQIW